MSNIYYNDYVTVFNDRAKTTLKARVTESVGPGVINITEGWWINQFKEGSVNHLTHDIINPVQEKVYEPNMHFNDVAVAIVCLSPWTDLAGTGETLKTNREIDPFISLAVGHCFCRHHKDLMGHPCIHASMHPYMTKIRKVLNSTLTIILFDLSRSIQSIK